MAVTPPQESSARAAAGRRHRINGPRLRVELVRRGLDGQTFARLAGISAATVSHVLNGRPASPRTVQKMALVLARTPALVGFEGDMVEAVSAPARSVVTNP